MTHVPGSVSAEDRELRDDASLVLAILVPVLVGVIIVLAPRWVALAGVLPVATCLLIGLWKGGSSSGTAPGPGLSRVLKVVFFSGVVVIWLAWLTLHVLTGVPKVVMGVELVLMSWICLGLAWHAGWLFSAITRSSRQ